MSHQRYLCLSHNKRTEREDNLERMQEVGHKLSEKMQGTPHCSCWLKMQLHVSCRNTSPDEHWYANHYCKCIGKPLAVYPWLNSIMLTTANQVSSRKVVLDLTAPLGKFWKPAELGKGNMAWCWRRRLRQERAYFENKRLQEVAFSRPPLKSMVAVLERSAHLKGTQKQPVEPAMMDGRHDGW